MLLVPTDPDTPLYTQRVTLDERDYILRFDYNQREKRIYLDVLLLDETVLVRGWKLVTGVALGPRVADRRMFAGSLIVETNTTDRSPPDLGELGEGRRCQLFYLPNSEL